VNYVIQYYAGAHEHIFCCYYDSKKRKEDHMIMMEESKSSDAIDPRYRIPLIYLYTVLFFWLLISFGSNKTH
jgi:hypothetical protein